MSDYYATEDLIVAVRVRIKYRKGDEAARRAVVEMVRSGRSAPRVDLGGCDVDHGCYGIKSTGVVDAKEAE